MGVLSGKYGVVNGKTTTRQWSINDNHAPKRYRASNTKNGAGRRNGIRSWSGSFNQYGAVPSVMPGALFTFSGYTAPTTGVLGTNGLIYTGTAIVDSVVITWNWGSGDILSMVTNFSGHLDLASSEAGALTDATAPTVPPICGTKITYDDTGDVEWENLLQATLTISAENQSYVNSSTGCWTGKTPGPIDWTASVTEQEVLRDILNIGDDYEFKFWVDDTDFWKLKWGKVKEFTGITVDMEGGGIIQRTVPLEMQGFAESNGAAGSITLPGAVSAWWPAS